MNKGHKRGTNVSNSALVRRGTSGALVVNKTRDTAYLLGQVAAQDEYRIYEGRSYLLGLLGDIANNIILTEGLPELWRGARLKIIYQESPELDQMDKLLADACYQLKGANDDFDAKYPTALGHKAEVDDQLILIANDFATEIRRLLESTSGYESGSALSDVLNKHGGVTFRSKLENVRRNTHRIGRGKGVDGVTRCIGDFAAKNVPEWGTKWALIGKRHYSVLEQTDKPTDIEREAIKKYLECGYPTPSGQWEWRSKPLQDIVRNAYRAVSGTA